MRFRTVEIARHALKREKSQWGQIANKSSSIWSLALFRIRTNLQRGGRPAAVLVDTRRHPNPRASVEAVLGPLVEFIPEHSGPRLPPSPSAPSVNEFTASSADRNPSPSTQAIIVMSDCDKLALRARLHGARPVLEPISKPETVQPETEQEGLEPGRLYPVMQRGPLFKKNYRQPKQWSFIQSGTMGAAPIWIPGSIQINDIATRT